MIVSGDSGAPGCGMIAAMKPDPSRRHDARGGIRLRSRQAKALTFGLGIVLGVFFAVNSWQVTEPALRVAALAAVALWVAEMFLGALTDDYREASPRQHTTGTLLLVVSQVTACALAFAPETTMVPLAIAGLVRLLRRSDRSVLLVTLTIVADVCGLTVSALVVGAPTELVIINLLVGAGVGLLTRLRASRIQSERQARALLEEQLTLQRERATTAALTERARIARDLHDVLAHSLGALTLQLDAAAALAQARRWGELETRIDRARGLAADGLAESRRAVAALREAPQQDLLEGIRELLRAHRDSGGEVRATLPEGRDEALSEGRVGAVPSGHDGTLPGGPGGTMPGGPDGAVLGRQAGALGRLSPSGTEALLRAVQEMLTNARRHAPGRPVTLEVRIDQGAFGPRADGSGVGDAGASGPATSGHSTSGSAADTVPVVRVTARNPVVGDSPTSPAPSDSSIPSGATTPNGISTSPAVSTPPGAVTAAASGPGGFGMRGMRERCEALGGGAAGRLVDGHTFIAEAWVPLMPSTDADHSGDTDPTGADARTDDAAAKPSGATSPDSASRADR